MNSTPKKNMDNFDWVTARSECGLAKVFATLKSQIQIDVNTRNGLLPKTSAFKFSLGLNGSSFIVLAEPCGPGDDSVTFVLTDKNIRVLDKDDKVKFEAILTLSNEGECRLKIGDHEYEFWYVRKMALEELFFRKS